MNFPTKVEPYSPQDLLLAWDSGENFAVSYFEVRFHCPCAGCVDEHTGRRVLKREAVPGDIKPLAVEAVGRYALQFRWSDGHGSGIYHFDTLKKLCESQGRKIA